MSLLDAALLEAFSLAELRDVVHRLAGKVQRLYSGNGALQAGLDAQQARIVVLGAENQALRDEVVRLKGLPPRSPLRPSGMEQATQPGAASKDERRPELPRGVKRDAQAITVERVLKAVVPAGAGVKGYEDILVRDLHLSAKVVRCRRKRWVTPLAGGGMASEHGQGGAFKEIRGFVGGLYGPDLHAKRAGMLASATLGVMTGASLAAAMIGQALA